MKKTVQFYVKYYLFTCVFINLSLFLNFLQATENYWIKEDFSDPKWLSELADKYSINEEIETAMFPGNILLKTFRTDAEITEASSSCPGVCLRSKDEAGYVEFTVPNAGTVTFHIKAKSSAANRTAIISRDGQDIGMLDGLDKDHCKTFSEILDTDQSVTYRIRSLSEGPIMISELTVTEFTSEAETNYWIKENFSNSKWVNGLDGKYSLDEEIKTEMFPDNIPLTTFRTDAEVTEASSSCPGVCLRSKDEAGYVEFTVPNAGTVTFHIKAKSSAANRTAIISRDGQDIGMLDGLDKDHCKTFSEILDTEEPVTYRIRSLSEGPIMISELIVSKFKETGEIPQKPVITISSSSTAYLNGYFLSGVMNDKVDPAATLGIDFDITGEDIGSMIIKTESSNQEVVSNENLIFERTQRGGTLRIIPTSVGYTTITITLSQNNQTGSMELYFAASAASSDPDNTIWHTGMSDASTAIEIDREYMFVGDDETNDIRLVNRNQSGLPIALFNFQDQFNASEEADIEASVRGILYPNRIYWAGSLGNSKSGNAKPYRNRIFATDIMGTGASSTLSYANHYENLREKIIEWGDSRGWDFSSSASVENKMVPKQIDGFNLEGLEIAPDQKTALFGFRAPLLPEEGQPLLNQNRKLALIVPIENFEKAMNDGEMDAATFGEPILMDLGGRSIRSLERLSNGKYIIVAGMYDGVLNPALFLWNGEKDDKPEHLECELLTKKETNPEGVLEIEVNENEIVLQLISDNGSYDFYNDGKEAKALVSGYKKFRSDIVYIPVNNRGIPTHTDTEMPANLFTVSPRVNNGTFSVKGKKANAGDRIDIYTIAGQKLATYIFSVDSGQYEIPFSIAQKGMCFVKLNNGRAEKIIIK
ncbi:MAG: hypothetical protein LUG18_08595 [Candidatus Azobacteroides sp.]|nr:hypothetical protein [Candidatus Azobacteroides sp.]